MGAVTLVKSKKIIAYIIITLLLLLSSLMMIVFHVIEIDRMHGEYICDHCRAVSTGERAYVCVDSVDIVLCPECYENFQRGKFTVF